MTSRSSSSFDFYLIMLLEFYSSFSSLLHIIILRKPCLGKIIIRKNVSEVEHVTECKSNGSVQKAFVELFYLLLTLFYIVSYLINKLFYVHEWTDGETE